MTGLFKALYAEALKNKYSNILWATFVAFGLAPIMGAVFIVMIRSGNVAAGSGLSVKMESINFTADWNSYFSILTQAIGVGGVLVFGFVASWIFGREYSDNTAKDLLSLPTSRGQIINSKFIVYVIWCLALVLSNLIIAIILGVFLQIPAGGVDYMHQFSSYLITTLLTILLGPPIAFFALWGKGYLAPLGFVALTLVFSQIIAATGFGNYFPWAIPGLYSGSGGDYKEQLNILSYGIVVMTSLLGFILTHLYWLKADHAK